MSANVPPSSCTSCEQDGGDATILVHTAYVGIAVNINRHDSNCFVALDRTRRYLYKCMQSCKCGKIELTAGEVH